VVQEDMQSNWKWQQFFWCWCWSFQYIVEVQIILFGSSAGSLNTFGSSNNFIGYNAGGNNTTGSIQ
jgi:hypothetical protein